MGKTVLNRWNPPIGTAANDTFSVQIRKTGDGAWEDLFVYNVRVGHQHGDPRDTSMVVFDFAGSVDLKVTYNAGNIDSHEIRPTSYEIKTEQTGNELVFSMQQNLQSPRKMVLRINGSRDVFCLHVLTNPPEEDAPSLGDANVLAIKPGDPIPLQLPEGKDTYYFTPGVHDLPRGMWMEMDLGAVHKIDRVGLEAGIFMGIQNYVSCYAQKFVLEVKQAVDEPYRVAFDGMANQQCGHFVENFPPTPARFVRLRLFGCKVVNDPQPENVKKYIFSNVIKHFEIFAADGTENLAKGRAMAGAMPGFEKAVDGNSETQWDTPNQFKDQNPGESQYDSPHQYGNWHAGESFFISKDNTTLYIAPGAVVKGAFASDGINNAVIKGGGILDCSGLTHFPDRMFEARTGAIWVVGGSDNRVEGITILDPPMWGVVMNYSLRPVVRRINFFGSIVNADGIHMSACDGGLVEGVFLRTCDDGFVAYHYGTAQNIIVRNSVFWEDDARNILLGMGFTPGSEIRDITIDNIDILNQQGVWIVDKFTGVMQLWTQGGTTIRNITLQNIRIDPYFEPSKGALFQMRTDSMQYGETEVGDGGPITNITIKNITYKGGDDDQPALMLAVSEKAYIKGVTIENYVRHGVRGNGCGVGPI